MLYKVKGTIRYNGKIYEDGGLVEIADQHAGPLMSVGKLELLVGTDLGRAYAEMDRNNPQPEGHSDVYDQDKANAALVEQIAAELSTVDGLPPELDTHSMVVWLLNTLDGMRKVMKSITETLACAVPPPPADLSPEDRVKWLVAEWEKVSTDKAETEPKDTPEAQAPDGPKDQPDPEPEPDPAKDAPKKRK